MAISEKSLKKSWLHFKEDLVTLLKIKAMCIFVHFLGWTKKNWLHFLIFLVGGKCYKC